MSEERTGKPVVVLGFGVAASNAVTTLREDGYTGPVTVVTDEGSEPYSPVLTSYYAGGRLSRDKCFAWSDLNLPSMVDEMRMHAGIAALDTTARKVVLNGGESLEYSKLLVATGAHPVLHGTPWANGIEPLVLRTMDDADRLSAALENETCRSVLVSGTSMVGLKVLEACLDRGIYATLLGRSPHILRSTAHPSIAARFEERLAERGVKLKLGQTVEHVERLGCDMGYQVAFDDGGDGHFDEIVCAHGVEPNLDFVKGESPRRDRGLIVDKFMRTSAADVYAAGDVAQALDLSTGGKRIIGLWQNAVLQGRCAAHAIADELAGRVPTRPFPGSVPHNVIHVGKLLFASAGSMRTDCGAQVELDIDGNTASAMAWKEVGGERKLVGYNILTCTEPAAEAGSIADKIGRYYADVRNSYLDEEGGS